MAAPEAILIDTDICSFLFKQDTRAFAYRSLVEGHILCLSFQSVAELYQWANLRNWSEARRAGLQDWLRRFVILPPSVVTAQHWGRLRAEAQRAGRPISPQDAWVAACALEHGIPLLTHNVKHFSAIEGLNLLSLP